MDRVMKIYCQKIRQDFNGAKIITVFALIGLIALTIPLSASDYEIFSMTNFSSGELRMQAFELNTDMDVHIDIVGARYRNSDQMYALGWILESETREVIWSMDRENTKRLTDEKNLRYFDEFINLSSGKYEAYYYAGKPILTANGYEFGEDLEEIGDLLDNLGEIFNEVIDMDVKAYAEMRKKYKFTLSAEDKDFKLLDISTPQFPNQVISIVRPRNLADVQQGFVIKEDMDITIYAQGEYSDKNDLFMDGAKIVNAKTREVVWAMERWNTDWCGGSSKNRSYFDDVYLDPGQYILHYWTNDSHTFDDWSGIPPYDPYLWGVTLAVGDWRDLDYIKPYNIDENRHVLAQIVRVGNNEHIIRDFTIKNELEVAIYAIGEGKRGYMYDYGWIENTDDQDVVWMMEEDETVHAGGASKNRLYDGTLDLDPGHYALHYKTDGSHSYRSWNEAAPSDSRNYGISLYNYDEDFNPKDFELGKMTTINELGKVESQRDFKVRFENLEDSLAELQIQITEDQAKSEEKHAEAMAEFNRRLEDVVREETKKTPKPPRPPKASNVLVRMNHLGDDVNMQAPFVLDSASQIRIYALGEGVNGSMYDYGWIDNAENGQTVWKMLYSKTTHAGGSGKNRMIDNVIMLEPGKYIVHYITDDSHSFPDWNATPPDDPDGWGIVIELIR